MKIKTIIGVLIAVLFSLQAYSAHLSNSQLTVKPNGIYKFSGMMNNKIPVFVWFVVKEDALKGEVTYLKTQKRTPIAIIGRVIKDSLDITEISKTGNITGFYHGKFDERLFSGTWNAPGSDKELKFDLAKKDTIVANSNITLNPVNVTGEYVYQFTKFGAGGGIDIQQTKPGYYTFRINCVTSSPANTIADTQAVNVHMVNNTITYKLPDGDCKFTIKAYSGFIIIDYVKPHVDCGFGMGAGIDGIFLKTSEKAHIDLM